MLIYLELEGFYHRAYPMASNQVELFDKVKGFAETYQTLH